jgi:hypothetical protein
MKLTRKHFAGIIEVSEVTTHTERPTRALVHIGLTVAIVLAPTLCCCKVRGLGAAAHASAPNSPQSAPLPAPTDSCHVKKTSCCHEAPKSAPKAPAKPTEHKPAPQPAPDPCACCGERPDVAQTESKPSVSAAEPTGELLPLVSAVAGSLEHLGLVRGAYSTDRAGVDARSAALFERHVMRC